MRGVKRKVASITHAAKREHLPAREIGDAVGQGNDNDIIGQGIEGAAVWRRDGSAGSGGNDRGVPLSIRADARGHRIPQHVVAVALSYAFVLRSPNCVPGSSTGKGAGILQVVQINNVGVVLRWVGSALVAVKIVAVDFQFLVLA